jgi:hypothetical protein
VAYSYQALKDLWVSNGGNPAASGIAAAVALAESGGNPDAIGHNSNGSVDRGLWQINSIHGAQSTTDVTGNVRSAIAISNNGTNWQPWTTFVSGAYRKFLNPADPALIGNSIVDPGIATTPSNPLDALASGVSSVVGGVTNAVKAGQWLANPHNTIRIFLVVSGGGMLLIGVTILFRGTIENTVSTVVDTAKSAANAAAVAA